MILSHRIALDPTEKQKKFFRKACGVSRYTWNWAVAESEKFYRETGKSVNTLDLKRKWNREKPEWVYESPKDANQQPFTNLKKAYSIFFKSMKGGTRKGKPVFKHKGERDSFYLSNDKFSVTGKHIRVPLLGPVRMREPLRFDGKIMGATVICRAGRWYASIQVDVADTKRVRTADNCVGIDLGVKTAITLSTGEKLEGPKATKKYARQLVKAQRVVSRRKKGSHRREKAKIRVTRIHEKISNVRNDFLHKASNRVCRENQTVVLEDLNVSGMVRNRRLAKAVLDIGMAEFRRQVEYKSKLYGTEVIVADRWFPSTKMCSNCGNMKTMSLSDRVYKCDRCGLQLDRDMNAAMNLHTLGLREINARGQDGNTGMLVVPATGLVEARTKQKGSHELTN